MNIQNTTKPKLQTFTIECDEHDLRFLRLFAQAYLSEGFSSDGSSENIFAAAFLSFVDRELKP